MTTQSITSGQTKQYKRLVEDAADKALVEVGLDKDGIQRIIERGYEFQAEVQSAAATALRDLSASNRFANEEVRSNYGYFSGYRKPVGVTDQIDILRSHWPQLNPDRAIHYMGEVYPKLQLPSWVEGPFALIRPGFFSNIYGEELEEVFRALAKDRNGKFTNCRKGRLGPERLRRNIRTVSMMNRIMEQQPDGDIIIVPEQFGIRHRGRSIRRAREVFVASEFGEDAKNVGTMILTNPTRLQHYDDIWINCAGDEYSSAANGQFDDALYFGFVSGRVEFDTPWFGPASSICGSISAVLGFLE